MIRARLVVRWVTTCEALVLNVLLLQTTHCSCFFLHPCYHAPLIPCYPATLLPCNNPPFFLYYFVFLRFLPGGIGGIILCPITLLHAYTYLFISLFYIYLFLFVALCLSLYMSRCVILQLYCKQCALPLSLPPPTTHFTCVNPRRCLALAAGDWRCQLLTTYLFTTIALTLTFGHINHNIPDPVRSRKSR